MRGSLLSAGTMLVMLILLVPQASAVMHDDPCGAAGDATNTWPGARALSAAGMGAGCTTESIAPINTCGVGADDSDWFFVDTLAAGIDKQIQVTLTFLFTFCGGPNINADLVVYFVDLGTVIPTALYTSPDGNGPGTKICESHNAGTAQEKVTCSPTDHGGRLGRYYIQKTRVSGTGASSLQVAFV